MRITDADKLEAADGPADQRGRTTSNGELAVGPVPRNRATGAAIAGPPMRPGAPRLPHIIPIPCIIHTIISRYQDIAIIGNYK